ncbi:hypothetical protein CVIRNUC_004312 [Coccomyxa viridis]|uniref:Rx N-terminal domain-containing protein n=1 Tax=Coccomyxa viridis TaxID=1274662 RepID=A0AAV1I4D6_9CHLO|nr:hypothetical protein CVIRNUC_004312 [Coccomyxa viridis]
MDVLLINLQILSKVPKYGRLKRAVNGLISLEDAAVFTNLKRWVLADGRHQSMADIRRIVDDAEERVLALLDSRFLGEASEEGRCVDAKLTNLYNALSGAVHGMESLSTTYAADLTLVAELDIVMVKIEAVLQRIKRPPVGRSQPQATVSGLYLWD